MNSSKIADFFSDPLQKVWQSLAQNLPHIFEASIILLAGLLVALLLKLISYRAIAPLENKLRKKLKAPEAARGKALARGARITSQIIFWGVLLFFLAGALSVLDQPVISRGVDKLAGYFPNILAAVLIVFLGYLGGGIVGAAVGKIFDSSKVGHGEFFGKLTRYAFLLTAVLIAIEQIGINISLLIVIMAVFTGMVAGGTALAFGFGAQVTVRSILATYYLAKHYRVGQRISVGEIQGKILQLESTYVLLETADGVTTIPSAWFLERPVHRFKND